MKTTAVVVTFNPPPEFWDHIGIWLSQVDELIIVDDGSLPDWQKEACALIQAQYGNVEFIANPANRGIAARLNQGFARQLEEGRTFTFVFDQDSLPAPGMVAEMLDVYQAQRSPIAIVAPHVVVPSASVSSSFLVSRGRFLFRRVRCTDQTLLDDVSIVISSGALYDLQAYCQIGPFREDFFIDYVDTEYCLRARQLGYKLVVACKASLTHQLGNQREARFGPLTMHPTFHSPLRWYYISRNRVPMMRRYAWRFPHWFFYELLVNLYGLARLVLFEDRKSRKALAMILGMWDGLGSRMGPVSTERRALLVAGNRS